MAALTRTQLESWKRPALQQKCKELGIKANSKSEVLIDLILAHHQSQQSGPSKPSTSTKRKAAPTTEAEEDPTNADYEQIASGDAFASAPQRLVSTRRRGAQNAAAPPPAKLRRVGTRSRVKAEPVDCDALLSAPVLPSPRHGQIMEVVLNSPKRSRKGKAKEVPVTNTQVVRDETELETECTSSQPQSSRKSIPGARPLEAHKTTSTEVEIGPARVPSVPPEALIDESRITDLELQLRNARKFSDEASRDIKILSTFRATIEDAFCHINPDDPNFPDSMTLLAKLRDITPKLVAVASVDTDALASRAESIEQKAIALESRIKQDQSTIAELKERVRELEEGKSAIGDLEAIVRQLQSRISALPTTLTKSDATEDSGTEHVYTLIRGPSYNGTASASGSQIRPLSRLSVPPEENGRPLSQDQNQGRASSISKGLRSTRPPLAEKEGVRVGQPDVEVETTDPRRSIRRLAESSLSSVGNSAPPSRGRSITPSQREPSSGNTTPSQGKGKGRLVRSAATMLDTVEEVGDTSTHEQVSDAGVPTTANQPVQQPSCANASPTPSTTSKPAAEDAEPERLPSPLPAPNPFSPDTQPPRSPARFFGPPPSGSQLTSKAAANRGSSPIRSLVPSATGDGPIMQLPFKLIASPTKPQAASSQSMSRPAAPTGRVPKAPRSNLQPYGRRQGGRKPTSEAPKEAASVFSFALPGASSSALTEGPASGAAANQLDNPAAFVTPERLGNNFNLFPVARFDFGKTPGGLAFKATGRAPPGTPAATTTLFGTEVARDTRFADLPYDLNASRGRLSWEEPGLSLYPGAASRNTSG
ncbi:hypothetical protein FRC10_000741 [Ceratobasidium sp. 414]|nr:hypothetical protein FRC10_000741 [Ceratobasidium sp. 414]